MSIQRRLGVTVLLAATLCGQSTADTIAHSEPLTSEERVKDLHLERLGVVPSRDGMVKGLSSPDFSTRAKCLDGLGLIGGEAEITALEKMCKGGDLQDRALWRLSAVCDRLALDRQKAVRDFLVATATEAYKRPPRHPGELAASTATLAAVGGPAHPEAILAALKDPAFRWYGLFFLNPVRERELREGGKPLTDWISPLKSILYDISAKKSHREDAASRLVDVGGTAAEVVLRAAAATEKDREVKAVLVSCLAKVTQKNKSLPPS